MERLFAYALFMNAGFCIEQNYEEYLHNQFLDNSEDEILLELEFISKDIEKTVSFLKEKAESAALNYELLAKELINLLKFCYETMNFGDFISKTYLLWQILPYELSHDEPLYELRFADDPSSYGVEVESKEIIEDILNFFEQ